VIASARSSPTSWRAVALTACLALAAACAPKLAPPPAIAPGAGQFPEYVYPVPPPGLGTTATVERHKAGWQWLQAGDEKAADRNFTASLKLTPGFYPAEVGLGYSALARKDAAAALTHFDRAIVANPRYAPALAGRGDALLARGQRAQALESFEAAVAADPSLTALGGRIEVLRFRGLQQDVAAARSAAEAGRLGEARTAYQQAIAASPQSPFLYRELAAVEQRDNDLPAALAHARRAAELDPADARARVLTGQILEAQQDLPAALEAYRAALAIEPDPELETHVSELADAVTLASMPPEYRAIETAPTITRAQLAALLGVRLDALLQRAGPQGAVVITDTRGSWAAPWIMAVTRSGVMEVYANHTFQPAAVVSRGDLARAASRVLSLIGSEQPALAGAWRGSNRQRFSDLSPRNLNYPAVSLAVEAGVMSAAPDGAFHLARPATGAEAIETVRKLEELARTAR
jgi:tetratricopeptide (TPR) repeat protein